MPRLTSATAPRLRMTRTAHLRIRRVLRETEAAVLSEAQEYRRVDADRGRKATARRPPDGERPDGGNAPLEVPRAPRLRVGPAVVGRLRDRGGAGRARRRIGDRGAS